MVGPATFLKNSSWSILLILVSCLKLACGSHCMKCPYSELFWSAFSLIWTEYVFLLRISTYPVRMLENADQNNCKYRHLTFYTAMFTYDAWFHAFIISIGEINFTIDLLHKKMKFFIKDFLSKCDQIRGFLRIWSHLLKKFWMENFIFCEVTYHFEQAALRMYHPTKQS